jgi:hypothetical protein
LELLGIVPFELLSSTFIRRSQRFFQFCKHSWNACFATLRCSVSTFSFNLLDRLKLSSFQDDFQLGEEKVVCWCKFWRVRRLGDERRLVFCEKITNRKGEMRWRVVMMEQPFFPSTSQNVLSSLPLSPFSSPSDNILCTPFGHKVEIHDELRPHHSITFTLDRTCRTCFGSG